MASGTFLLPEVYWRKPSKCEKTCLKWLNKVVKIYARDCTSIIKVHSSAPIFPKISGEHSPDPLRGSAPSALNQSSCVPYFDQQRWQLASRKGPARDSGKKCLQYNTTQVEYKAQHRPMAFLHMENWRFLLKSVTNRNLNNHKAHFLEI